LYNTLDTVCQNEVRYQASELADKMPEDCTKILWLNQRLQEAKKGKLDKEVFKELVRITHTFVELSVLVKHPL
jgi:hypothetical protein